jgi:hypothetical protein
MAAVSEEAIEFFRPNLTLSQMVTKTRKQQTVVFSSMAGALPPPPPRQLSISIPGWWALATSPFKSPVEWLAPPPVCPFYPE